MNMSWEALAEGNEASNNNQLKVPELAKIQKEQVVTEPV